MMRAALLALALAGACSSSPPAELPPPQLPERAGVDPIVAARAEGVEFRAVGEDFVLQIYREGRIRLAWEQQQQDFPKPAPILPRWNGEIYETSNDAHTLRIEIRRVRCVGAGGETFPASVTIVIDGEELSGCGASL